MMENEFQRLSREAKSYMDIMRCTHDKSANETDTESTPHIETIDFDRLHEFLDRVSEQMNAAYRIENESRTVRQWLIGRIESIARGQRAMMHERGSDHGESSLSTVSLGELIRRFEDITASVRTSAFAGQVSSRKSRLEYKEFRS